MGVVGEFFVYLLKIPVGSNVTGFAVLVVRLYFIRNVMSGVIGNIHNLILMISVYVFSQSCNSGSSNLVDVYKRQI